MYPTKCIHCCNLVHVKWILEETWLHWERNVCSFPLIIKFYFPFPVNIISVNTCVCAEYRKGTPVRLPDIS